MSLNLKSNNKFKSDRKSDYLTLEFFKQFSSQKENCEEKKIGIESNSDEIADIISRKLLRKIEKEIVL